MHIFPGEYNHCTLHDISRASIPYLAIWPNSSDVKLLSGNKMLTTIRWLSEQFLNGSDIMCLASHAVIIVKFVPIYMKVVRKSWVIVLVTRKTLGLILNYQHITTVRSFIPTSGQRYPTNPVQSDLVDRPTLLIHWDFYLSKYKYKRHSRAIC